MHSPEKVLGFPMRRAAIVALSAIMACCLSFPSLAFAAVRVDETELAQGDNAVGGGTASLADSVLNMVGVTVGELFTDEDLSINFNGENEIGEVNVAGSAEVEMSFSGENEVDEVHSFGESDVTINANGHNEFEEIEATEQSSITINVTGENDFEEIVGRDDASITVRGTDCQKKDTINLGEDEQDTQLTTERGTLVIDHVTVNLQGEEAIVGSEKGDVRIDTSKVAKDDDNEYAYMFAGGTMLVRESVIDITDTICSDGQMTIEHSDVKAEKPDAEYGDDSPYRVYSKTGIELIDEENGEVEEGELNGDKVWYVDTDDNDGEDVDLEADGDPEYYRCKSSVSATPIPKTGDGFSLFWLAAAGAVGAAAAVYATRRREEH